MRSKRQSEVNNLNEQVHHNSLLLSESKIPSMMVRAKPGEGFNPLAFGCGGLEGPTINERKNGPFAAPSR
jgi:hypothetical protein